MAPQVRRAYGDLQKLGQEKTMSKSGQWLIDLHYSVISQTSAMYIGLEKSIHAHRVGVVSDSHEYRVQAPVARTLPVRPLDEEPPFTQL